MVARTDTLAREIGLFTANRQETDTIKEIRRACADFFLKIFARCNKSLRTHFVYEIWAC